MGSFRCNGCCQYFKKLTEVKKHLQMQHYNLLDACMFCDHCSEMFVNRQSLEKHMFVHVEEVFQCLNCKKKFLTAAELENHNNKTQKCKPKVAINNQEYILGSWTCLSFTFVSFIVQKTKCSSVGINFSLQKVINQSIA